MFLASSENVEFLVWKIFWNSVGEKMDFGKNYENQWQKRGLLKINSKLKVNVKLLKRVKDLCIFGHYRTLTPVKTV